jgi:phosphoenolpyruvate---glycerone phosphotransferase subunit DhaM
MTVGVVLLSHSRTLAAGAAELAGQLAGETRIAPAGGTADGGLGTSIDLLAAAVSSVAGDDGVVIIADLGSAVLTARTYLADDDELPCQVILADAPFTEGAVAAAVLASTGATLAEIQATAEDAWNHRKT